MNTKYRVTAVIIRDHRILLIHRYKQGDEYWVFPGGGVEDGESLEAALHREIREETGLELVSWKYLSESQENPGCIFYACELQAGEIKLGGPELAEQSPDNVHILEWVDIRNVYLLQPLYPKPNLNQFS